MTDRKREKEEREWHSKTKKDIFLEDIFWDIADWKMQVAKPKTRKFPSFFRPAASWKGVYNDVFSSLMKKLFLQYVVPFYF